MECKCETAYNQEAITMMATIIIYETTARAAETKRALAALFFSSPEQEKRW